MVLWLGVLRTAHCMERGAWAALLTCEAVVVLSKGSSNRNVSWSTSSLWLLLLSESLESLDWESSSEKKAGTLLAPWRIGMGRGTGEEGWGNRGEITLNGCSPCQVAGVQVSVPYHHKTRYHHC